MSATVHPRNTWKLTSLVFLGLFVGLVIRDGADREPADPCRPIVASPSFSEDEPHRANTLKVASFNIHGGKGTDGTPSLDRITALLNGSDLVGLSEVRNPGFRAEQNQAARIAAELKLGAAFVATERHWWREHFGNAVLSRGPLGPIHRLPLPGTRGKAFRTAILTSQPWNGVDLQVLIVHVDREHDRIPQLRQVVDLFLKLQPPAIVMGDLNTPVSDPILQELLGRDDVRSVLHEGLPHGPPEGTIDWIFQRGLETVSAELVSSTASDHPVVKAEFRLSGGPSRSPDTP